MRLFLTSFIGFATAFLQTQTLAYVGGKAATLSDAPGAVVLVITGDSPQNEEAPEIIGDCSAVVIAKRWILTAAHCVKDMKVTSIRLSRGQEFYMPPLGSDLPRPGKALPLKRVHIYPGFSDPKKGRPNDVADVALVELESDLSVKAAKLSDDAPRSGSPIQIGGWGIPADTNDLNVKIVFQGEDLVQLKRHLRYGNREINASSRNMFDVFPKPFPMKVVFGKGFDEQYQNAGFSSAEVRKEIIRSHQYEHLSFGDSGGPVYGMDKNGSKIVLGVNSLEDSLNGTVSIHVQRFARVDAQSPAGKWIKKLAGI